MSKEFSTDVWVARFGFACLSLVLLVIVASLVFLLYQATNRIAICHEQKEELRQTAHDQRRMLDRLEGRIQVFETFLIGTQVSAFDSMVKRYLRTKRVKSDKVTLSEFEDWLHVQNSLGGAR